MLAETLFGFEVRGVAFVSCYFIPNEGIHEFQETLDRLEDILREWEENITVAGDLNVRAIEWGMPNTDTRERRVLELAARLSHNVINVGKVSTCRRPGYAETILDVTLASESVASKTLGWKVREAVSYTHLDVYKRQT